MMQSHDNAMMEERFEEHMKKKFRPDEKHSTSGVISAAFGEKNKKCLKILNCFLRSFGTVSRRKKSRYLKFYRPKRCFSNTKI